MKESKGPKAPKPAPSYKFALLGSIDNDTRGFLPLTQFLTLALDGMRKQRTKDAKELQAICDQWLKDGGVDSFELFAAVRGQQVPTISLAHPSNNVLRLSTPLDLLSPPYRPPGCGLASVTDGQ